MTDKLRNKEREREGIDRHRKESETDRHRKRKKEQEREQDTDKSKKEKIPIYFPQNLWIVVRVAIVMIGLNVDTTNLEKYLLAFVIKDSQAMDSLADRI